jgi:hypothetical protein
MDADDWLKTIEKKLHVVQCNNREKVLFASHQLEGPAVDWWDAYVGAHEEPESINWQEFKNSFCSHHVPAVTPVSLKPLITMGNRGAWSCLVVV